eukprot:238715_1
MNPTVMYCNVTECRTFLKNVIPDKIKTGAAFGLSNNIAAFASIPLNAYRIRLQTAKTVSELEKNNKLDPDDVAIDMQNFTAPKLFGYDGFLALYSGSGYRMISYYPMFIV